MKKRDGHMHPNIMKKPIVGENFITRAIELGFEEIVFTDHMPFSVTGDEHDRIPFGKVGDYCHTVSEYAEKYKDKIKILTGIEIDFHPDHTDEVHEVLSCGKFDLILASSHLNIKGFGIPFEKMTRSEYAELVIQNYLLAAESGLFDVITHLDIYRLHLTEPENFPLCDDGFCISNHANLLKSLFSAMEKNDIALEVNAAPLYKCFDTQGPYPTKEILSIASEYNIRRVYGSDAHTVNRVGFAYDSVKGLLSN